MDRHDEVTTPTSLCVLTCETDIASGIPRHMNAVLGHFTGVDSNLIFCMFTICSTFPEGVNTLYLALLVKLMGFYPKYQR